MLSLTYAEGHFYAECRYAECHYTECRNADCHGAENITALNAECRYAVGLILTITLSVMILSVFRQSALAPCIAVNETGVTL